ncbi:MAG TPA: hypothetical protein VGM64_06780 [Lacunisphaera sp.]
MTTVESPASRAVLTLALGPPVYWNMAVNLARSIRRWHSVADLPVYIATDSTLSVPPDLTGVHVIKLRPNELGVGFETKLHLDRLAPAPRTLFIDSDCLVYESLDLTFDLLKGRPVATIGGTIDKGEWFGDVALLCQRLGVPAIPVFNGGIYYIERGETATRLYNRAREMAPHYDEMGLVRLRGQPNEELLMASAMAQHGLSALKDDGTITSDPQSCPGPMSSNILSGRRTLLNPAPPSPLHCARYPFENVSPAIVHFLDDHTHRTPYRTDVARLKMAALKIPDWLGNLIARVTVEWPGRSQILAKKIFRPLYHRIFGMRNIPRSERLP